MNNGSCTAEKSAGLDFDGSIAKVLCDLWDHGIRLGGPFVAPPGMSPFRDKPPEVKPYACSVEDFRARPAAALDHVILGGRAMRLTYGSPPKPVAVLLPQAEWSKLTQAYDNVWEFVKAQASESVRETLRRPSWSITYYSFSTALLKSDPGRVLDPAVYADQIILIKPGEFASCDMGNAVAVLLPIKRYNEFSEIRCKLEALIKGFDGPT